MLDRLLRTVPPPQWHGYTPEAPRRYAEFARTALTQGRMQELTDQSQQLAELRESRDELTESIRSNRSSMQEAARIAERLRSQLSEPPDDEKVLAMIDQIKAIPNVIGIRIDGRGQPVVLFRAYVTFEGTRYDMGDVELTLAFPLSNDISVFRPIDFVRTPDYKDGHGFSCRGGFEPINSFDGIKRGYVNFTPSDTHLLVGLLESGELYAYCVMAINRICSCSDDNLECFPALPEKPEDDPAPPWSGYMEGLPAIFRTSIDGLINARIHREISRQERVVADYKEAIDRKVERIRKLNSQIPAFEARVRQLQQEAEAPVVLDEQALMNEFQYIMGLEGVMGMRFTNNGTPVFHVRTSHVRAGRRYDLGDFEITLERSSYDHRAVLVTCLTRHPNGYGSGSTPYFHGASDVPDRDGRIRGWFCFGNRASELHNYFQTGRLGMMMHLLINTMNAINDGDEGVLRRYPEIRADAVWRRPRRRLRSRRQQIYAPGTDQLTAHGVVQ